MAAVEIYNKPTVEYREQTFAILFVNAWETFLKARIVQQNENKIQSLYVRQKNSRRYRRDTVTGDIRTIDITTALNRAQVRPAVRDNVSAMVRIRNEAVHLGLLAPNLGVEIRRYGAAGIVMFANLSLEWFEEPVHKPYLLPVGFLDVAEIAVTTPPAQRPLLKFLEALAKRNESADPDYQVAMDVRVTVHPTSGGGGSIGATNDPDAPLVRLEDDAMLDRFPDAYVDVVEACLRRYSDLRRNNRFHEVMREVNSNPDCAFQRPLDPRKKNGVTKRFYNRAAVFSLLDRHYGRK